ncbi:MlaD family protein [Mycobacteroides abscessus]|uniref:MlaD family protein n=1 Tax=Mycobacteroides abscessus TaxID=36809 RepID=UPI0013FCF9A9|nr:MlaD family protein [Mycobacteroides abscessus]
MLVASTCTALAYVLIVNGLQNPVPGSTATYPALFTDVSGVRPGADVRRQGVQVGKVNSIKVVRAGDGNVAELELELIRNQRVTTATRLSVKFQNLTGARYVDIRDDDVPNPAPLTRIPLAQTIGSFDITTLFHGLAPVLRTLEPAEVNDLTGKLAIFLEGDGAGTADLVDSIRTLAAKTADNQQTISTLVQNIEIFAKQTLGRSDRVVRILSSLKTGVEKVLAAKDLFGVLAERGPNFLAAINRLIWVIGLRDGTDLNAKFDVMRANLYRIPEFFERLPGMYAGTQPQLTNPGSGLNCSNGRLTVPPMVKVFLADQQVVLCNR